MFREMRRKNQQLPREECCCILEEATSGVLAVSGDDGYPYAVPLSFAYADGRLYFHVAKSGHKLDALRRNPKASFCIIERDEIVPAEYTHTSAASLPLARSASWRTTPINAVGLICFPTNTRLMRRQRAGRRKSAS